MELETVLKIMKERADPRAVTAWERLGIPDKPYIGLSLTALKALARETGKSHELAAALWGSGIHDAQLLATYVEEPKKVTEEQLDRWVRELDFIDLADKLASNVVLKTPFAYQKLKEWTGAKEEFVRRAGFWLLAELAGKDKKQDHALFEPYIALIEKELQGERNWVREAMNWALIAIGGRSGELNRKALKAAHNIGEVEVDYGDTSCKLPVATEKLTNPKLILKLGL